MAMISELTAGEIQNLEMLADEKSMGAIVRALIQICEEKSEHVNSVWQDEELAEEWENNAKLFRRVEKDMVF